MLYNLKIGIFNNRIGLGLSCWSKIPFGSPTISKLLLPTSIKTSWPVRTATSSKYRQIGVYLNGITIQGKIWLPKEGEEETESALTAHPGEHVI